MPRILAFGTQEGGPVAEYFGVLSAAVIAIGCVLLALSRGVHIQNLKLFVLGNVPLAKAIDIPAFPRLFWPSLAVLVIGAGLFAVPYATNLARQTFQWYAFTPITNMTQDDLAKCKKGRTNFGYPYVGNANLDHFLALVIDEYKRCARDIDFNNTGPYAEKYLSAVGEKPGAGWVAAFVSWAIKESNLDQYVEVSSESADLKANFAKKGLLIEGIPDKFLIGDIVFLRTTEDQPNSIYPTVLIAGNDEVLLLVSGNNRNSGFEYGGGMVGAGALPTNDARINSVGRFNVERRPPPELPPPPGQDEPAPTATTQPDAVETVSTPEP